MSDLELPPLPVISDPSLRKHAFTHASVFRLPPDQLDQIENVDNDRLSFLGRAAVDLVLATLPGASSTGGNVAEELAACAETYDIVKRLHMGWRATPAFTDASATTVERTMLVPTAKEAAQLMEAYIGALMLQSEPEALEYTRALVAAMRGLPPPPAPSPPLPPPKPAAPTNPGQALTKLHDLAAQRKLRVSYTDNAEGPKHAQQWTSELELHDDRTKRAWKNVARGWGVSKKSARADAAGRAVGQWEEILGSF
ncbi:hypothetical protein BDV93DRAFT_527025 [Ceratobasidium sp. AG-I]|nr:hypothetical protein BDV93DRAFT_527025 [Ceratobasidium sp. AG-I]